MGFRFAGFFDGNGFFKPDPDPTVLQVTTPEPESLEQRIARLVGDARIQADISNAGFETFEEADDFEMDDDDFDPRSPWEANFDLAAIAAEHGGVIQPPTPEQRQRAATAQKRAIQELNEYAATQQAKKVAKPPKPKKESSPEPSHSEGDDD